MLSRAQILRYLRLRYSGWASLALAFAASVFTLYLDSRVRSEFEGRRFALPARIYARPLELHAGLRIAQPDVEQELRDLGYPDVPREGESGWFARSGNELEIALRPFVFWTGRSRRSACAWRSTAVRSRRCATPGARSCRSCAWSRCRSAASTRRTTRTGCWSGSPRCRNISCRR